MVAVANLLLAFVDIMAIVLNTYLFIIIARVILSWVNADPRNPIVHFIYVITEPFLYQIRRRLPFALQMGLDISPWIACLCIIFLQRFLIPTAYTYIARLH